MEHYACETPTFPWYPHINRTPAKSQQQASKSSIHFIPISRYKEPNPLPQIPRPPFRPQPIRSIKSLLPCPNIRLPPPHPPRPLPNLPENKQSRINDQRHIRGHKPTRIEPLRLTRERVEAVEEDDDDEENQAEPGGVGLEGGTEDEGGAGDVLAAEGGVEAQVGDADADPGEHGRDGGDVLEPGEDFCGAGAAGHEGEERDGGGG